MKGANFAYAEMSRAYACALACAIVAGAVVICTCNRHQFHEHVEYIQHMHICIYDACMQMAVWDVGLQWAQMFKNLWPKLSVQNRQGGVAASKHAGKL